MHYEIVFRRVFEVEAESHDEAELRALDELDKLIKSGTPITDIFDMGVYRGTKADSIFPETLGTTD